MAKNNIVLIGMPGVGKSTIGVILAKVLGREFVDTDLVIQNSEGKLLKEIIAEKGPDGFLDVEDRCVSALSISCAVIATGGSIVYGEAAMRHLSENGIILYLSQEMKTIKSRLININNRGVVFREGQTFEDLYRERCLLYERWADITVDEAGLDTEQTLEAVLHCLEEQKLTDEGV